MGAVIALQGSPPPKQGPSYSTLAVRFITPVLTDNDQLAHDMAGLTPTSSPATVQSDVSSAQAATKTAQQLLASLKPGPGNANLKLQINTALTSESAWLQTASTVLANNGSPLVSQLSGLGLDAQSKFQALGASLRTVASSQFPSSSQLVTFVSAKNGAAIANLANAEFSNQVMALLNQAASAYQTVNSLYEQLNNAANGGYTNLTVPEAEQQMNSVISNRTSLAASAQALNAPTAVAQTVQSDLVSAFNASLADDNDIANCLNADNNGSSAYIDSSCLSSSSNDNNTATTDKQTFFTAYNQLRASVGQSPVNTQF